MYKNNSSGQNWLLLGFMTLLIAIFIYHMFSPYLSYDEMWSYNYYTANPFYYSFFTYSSYPLFEMTTHFFKWLPFPVHVNLRLSPFIFGIASCFLLYACLRKYFGNHFTAMAGLAAFALTPLVFVYMVNARGVMHELFFAIAGLFSCLFWLQDKAKKKYLVIYVIAGVLGLYSMTTHILFLFLMLAAVFLQLLKKDKPAAFLFIKINVLILIFFSVIYAPILLTTGISVYKGVIIKAPSYYIVIRQLPTLMLYVFINYAGNSSISLGLFLAAIPAMLFLKNRLPEKMRFLSVVTMWLPVSLAFFYLATKFLYAGRSLAFGALAIPLFICLFVQMAQPVLEKIPAWRNGAGMGIIILVIILNGYSYLPVRPIYKYMHDASGVFLNSKIVSCYDNCPDSSGFFYYYPAIEYYYRLQHKTIQFTLAAKNSIRYKPLLASDVYDCIVYDVNATDSRLKDYHEMYTDPFGKFKVWTRNDLK